MKFLRRVGRWRWLRRHDAALADEIEYHRALIQADFEARGLTPVEAAAASRRAMGNTTLAREDARDVWIASWADRLWRDARCGVRGLRGEPTFALTAILILALGVATTATVFSVVDAELWKPLPYPHPRQLVAVYSRGPGERGPVEAISLAELLAWRAEAPAFADLAAEGRTSRQVLRLSAAESVVVTEVTANYFATLGRPAVAGRTLTTSDARGSRAAVLTDRAWRRVFAADPSVVGRVVTLDAQQVLIAGVVRADDSLGSDPDLFVAIDERVRSPQEGNAPVFFGGIGRLKPGIDVSVARTQLQAAATGLAQQTPDERPTRTMYVEDLREYFTGYNWRPLYFFLGSSLVVLLLSAVNVAALLLGRAIGRTREFALRGALGGGQGALARQLLVEGALLAVPGGALGLLVTTWAVSAFTAALPADALARGTAIPVDLRVCAFAFGATALTTGLFGLMPMLAARRIELSGALGPGGRTSRPVAEGRARMVLLTAQVALTVILLSGAGLFLKSYVQLTQVPLGFDPEGRLAVRASLSGPEYATDAQVRAFGQALLDRARATPGVRDAGLGSSAPLGSGPLVNFLVGDQARPAAGEEPRAILRAASPGYFRTLGIRIVRGRGFSAGDVNGAPRVAIVNAYLASTMFGGTDPLGQVIHLLPGPRTPWKQPGALEVVGVVANVKEVGINEVEFADLYVPFAQMPPPVVELVVRAGVPPASLGDTLRRAAAGVDPAVPVTQVSTFEQRVAGALRQDRFNLLLIACFAGMAILLAGIGVYGAVAYAVEARTREFGVRLALGARPARLVGAALWQAGRIGLAGGALGLAGMLGIGRLLGHALYLVPREHSGLLYGVTMTDPVMIGSALLGMMMVVLAAGAFPARRVARVDPMRALRGE
jgi:putative ABC transport system permease protein